MRSRAGAPTGRLLLKTVHLHIGPHKSGTSTMQKFLAERQDDLAARFSLRFCRTGRSWPRQNINLAWQFQNPKFFDPANGAWADAASEIAAAPEHAAVLSSELFSRFSDSSIAHVAETLRAFDCRILFYGRAPADWLESSYAQSFRNLTPRDDALSYLDFVRDPGARRPVAQILPVLDRWAAAFGKDAIVLRSFETARTAPDGGLLADFATQLGVQGADFSGLPQQRNPRIGIKTMGLFHAMSRLLLRTGMQLDRKPRDTLRNAVNRYGRKQGWNEESARFNTAETLALIAERYEPQAQEAFRTYAGQEITFARRPAQPDSVARLLPADQVDDNDILGCFDFIAEICTPEMAAAFQPLRAAL